MVDVVVIGSGFGGAVAACRLAQGGRSVLVLERGRRWEPKDYPRDIDDAWIWDHHRPERNNGWIDLRVLDEMCVALGSGVGGGSLIYANISIDAKKEAFASGWPAEINYEILKPYYETVADMLRPVPVPENQRPARFKLVKEAAEAIGAGDRFRPLDLAVTFDPNWSKSLPDAYTPKHSKPWTNAQGKTQGTCIHCGNCDIGCDVQAKNTLDLNYIAAAETAGAEVRPLSLVSHIVPKGDSWCVHFDRLEDGARIPDSVVAKEIILAAGSLGSTEILLRSRDEYRTLPNLSRRLGGNWSSNGDFLTPAFYSNREIGPTIGPTITCAVDFLDGSEGGARFFVEDGGFANVLRNALASRKRHVRRFGHASVFLRLLSRTHNLKDPLSNMMPWFGQAVDGSDGRLYLGRTWWAPWRRQIALDWNPSRSEKAVGGLIAMHLKLTKATDGRASVPFTWSVFRNLITPHPLGGCSMASAPSAGVVDDGGRVFGHPGLYVMDGAIIPRAIGLNPSKTIAALAERAVALMLQG